MRKYTETHEWLDADDDVVTVGLTPHAVEQLGDLVFVELPEVGRSFSRGDPAVTVESVKAASELYSPVSGEVVEVNEAVAADPSLVNADPVGEGWFFRIRATDITQQDEFLDEAGYQALL